NSHLGRASSPRDVALEDPHAGFRRRRCRPSRMNSSCLFPECRGRVEPVRREALSMENRKFVLVVHGGAGNISNEVITADKQREAREGLEEALHVGHALLAAGGSSLDAVEATVKVLENNPMFNAGKGAAFNKAGGIELDAAIMDGKPLPGGVAGGETTTKTPTGAARAVMERSPHVMLIGLGADQFADEVGLEIVKPSYFWTPERWEQLKKELKQESH